jgi:hypothetical protein
VRLLIGSLFAFAVAALVGLGMTWFTLSHGVAFGDIRIGAWTARPKTGSAEIDPYSRASIARTGELPVGAGDGVAFYASATDSGRPLSGTCVISISGITPPARFWTLTLYDPEGRTVPNGAERYGFTSQEVARRSNGTFEVVAAPRARPGNWLPTGGIDRYVLVLRLYDTPIGVATRGREVTMPTIVRRSCP